MGRVGNLWTRVRGGEPLPAGYDVELRRGERVLTWGRVRGGGLAVATDFGLSVLAGGALAATYPWHTIARATWAEGVLHVEDLDGARADYLLSEPRGVPAAVREHVNASLVVSERHVIRSDVGIRVVGRRNLESGAMVWSAIADPGHDVGDPELRADVDGLVAAVRRKYGG